MLIANLTRYDIGGDSCDCGQSCSLGMEPAKDGDYVKFEDAKVASSNSLQQLKAEILRYADEGVELCFSSGCDERIAARFEKIIAKLSAI